MNAHALIAGFADPVRESQAVFRAAMMALARPATVQPLIAAVRPPAPLTPELAAVALALADHEAALWLDARLAANEAVADYLRFHTGARVAVEPADAAFALIGDPVSMPDFATFACGTDEYPDRSTTLVIAVSSIREGEGLAFSGPGIKGRAAMAVTPLPADFQDRLTSNRARFPRGVDCIFVTAGAVAALPRSASVEGSL